MNYFSVDFLCHLLKAFVHPLNNGIVVGSGIILRERLIFEFGFGSFSLFVVDRSVSEVVNLTLDLLFGFDSQIVRLRSFLGVGRFSDFDQVAGF
jgi:hypothetical protein